MELQFAYGFSLAAGIALHELGLPQALLCTAAGVDYLGSLQSIETTAPNPSISERAAYAMQPICPPLKTGNHGSANSCSCAVDFQGIMCFKAAGA